MARDFDLILFGATGFTGSLTARYLAGHAPPGLRWALAGRSRERLSALRDQLGADVAVVTADVDDPRSVRDLAESTRVVATTVGPYIRYGEPLVAACASAGTDYADITGEPEFVDRMFLAHHATAERTGARLVHACGFDSVPHDLGAQFTVAHLAADAPITMRGYVRASGSASGGTFASALTAFGRLRQAGAVPRRRGEAEHAPEGRRVRAVSARPGYDRATGHWVLPLPTIDPQIVVRSARALPEYGPDFTYSHVLALRTPFTAAGLLVGAGTTVALAQLPPARRLLLRARPAGTGPSEEQRSNGWFRVRFVARGATGRVVTEVSGGDPGYTETATMLGESALCLLGDPLPETAGQVTTAIALGAALRGRLERAGISFRVVEQV